MAVEMERGFSIRGHVAKMRTVDAAKCQLFDGESLPPMDVRTFRWWSDVAAAQPQTSKQKTSKKKKRSILEIFKVAPQITAVDGKSDGGELERTEVTGGEGLYYADLASVGKREGLENKLLGNNCRVEKKKKKVKNKVNKGKLQIKKGKIQTKNVKEKKKHKDDTTTSSISISQLIQEIKRKKMLKKSLNLSTNPQKINKKNKKIPSILSEKENSLKLSPKSTTPKPQIKNCSVQSILKKQIKTSPFKKKVTFSEKDDILGNKNSSSHVINETNNIINETLRDIQNEISPLSSTPDLNQIIDCSDNNCIEIRAEDFTGEITKEPSSSCLINLLEGPIDTTNKYVSNNKDVVSYNNKDLINNNKDVISVSSSTGSNKSMSVENRLNNDCMSNNICFDEDYIGLPLNSQGELTINPNFNPNPNPISGELFYRQDYQVEHNLCPRPVNIMPKISSNNNNNINHAIIQTSPLYYKDKFGAEHYYAPLMPVKPGFGFANIPGFERMEILPNGPSSFYQLETNNVEPTVRLMGKNVSLGKNSNSIIGDVHFASKNNNNNNSINGDVHFASKNNNNNNSINGDVHFSSKNNNYNSINGDVHFSSNNNNNSKNGDVHFASKNNNNNSINGDVQLSNRYVNPITRYCEYNRQMPAQQILLNSTHCKHSQSQSQNQHVSFASSSITALPQWILNPKSITHKPAFPSYTNPNTHNYNYNYNNNNMPSNYSPTYPHYVSSRPKLNFIKPTNHLNNPHNKRPRLETGLDLIPNPTWQMDGFNNQAVKAQTANMDLGESKLRSGPVKLSAGARHVLTPGTDIGPVNSKPVYCTVPLTCGTRTSQKSSEIYRF